MSQVKEAKGKLPKPTDEEYREALTKFEAQIKAQGGLDGKNGLLIALVMTSSQGAMGTNEDRTKMTETFGSKLNFAIWTIENPNKDLQIPAVMKVASQYEYPSSVNKIFVYYSGHGGSTKDGRKFIIPYSEELDFKPCSYIREEMVMFFEPSNFCRLKQDVARVFLFDSCLSQDPVKDPPDREQTDVTFYTSCKRPLIIAHATSMTEKAVGQLAKGGRWTSELCDNIEKFSHFPFTYILDKTWDGVVNQQDLKNGVQGPHYLCYMGPLFLKEGDKKLFYARNKVGATDQQSNDSQPAAPPVSRPTPSVSDDIDLEKIYSLTPDKADLKAAILEDLEGTDELVWKERFGKRLKGPNATMLSTTTSANFLIDLLYDKHEKPRYVITWESILRALEKPTQLKRKDERLIADTVRDYMADNYRKYEERLKKH